LEFQRSCSFHANTWEKPVHNLERTLEPQNGQLHFVYIKDLRVLFGSIYATGQDRCKNRERVIYRLHNASKKCALGPSNSSNRVIRSFLTVSPTILIPSNRQPGLFQKDDVLFKKSLHRAEDPYILWL
jgi:hypothetical protein